MYTRLYVLFFHVNCISLFLHVALIIDTAIASSLQQEINSNPYKAKETNKFNFLDPKLKEEKEYYAFSPSKLIYLAELEQDVFSILLNYNETNTIHEFEMSEMLIEDIDTFLLDYKDGALVPTANVNPLNRQTRAYEVASNPLLSYRMLRRFTMYIELFFMYIEVELPPSNTEFWDLAVNGKSFKPCVWCKKLRRALTNVNLPKIEDAKDAMDAILNIQMYYNFTSLDLSKGIFGSLNTTGSLTVDNMIELGLQAKEIENWVLAVEWLELGLSIWRTTDTSSENYLQVVQQLQECKIKHDAMWEEQQLISEITKDSLTLFKNKFSHLRDGLDSNLDEKIMGNKERVRVMDTLKLHEILPLENTDQGVDLMRYWSLCSGKNYQSAEEKRRLYCWFERESHPYWTINPLKLELLHSEPRIVQVYNLLGDGLLNEIKTEGLPILKMAETVNVAEKKTEVNDYRTAVNGWIYDRETVQKESFYKNLKFFTGFNVRKEHESEFFQVAGYSSGGQYKTHLDCLEAEELTEENGERIATFMAYINDVKAGGLTAFRNLGTAANPVKGSGVFWYNILKNGTCDKRTLHGACPVILENKYVFNIWIRSNANFLKRPCDLNRYK